MFSLLDVHHQKITPSCFQSLSKMFIARVRTIIFVLFQFSLIRSSDAGVMSSYQHARLSRRHRTVLNPRKVLPFAPNGIDASQYDSSLTTECKIPEISETIKVTGPTTVPAGEVFDCKFAKYQYDDTSCELERELGNKYAVFNLEEGATLKNCFLGFSQESKLIQIFHSVLL